MDKIIQVIDKTTDWIGQIFSWLSLFIAILLFIVVILRYGFNLGWIWMQEMVTYGHAMLFMILAGYTLLKNEHVRVDILYQNMSERTKAKVNFFGLLFLLLPTAAFVVYYSTGYVVNSWSILETSRESGGLPFVFFLKTFIPLFGVTLFVQGISELLKCIKIMQSS